LDDKTEHFYHALVHLHFRYLGFNMDSEVHTSDGRMDAVVQTASHVFIIEFKMNVPAQVALDQIMEKK
jgi:PD-(D/E)XK nuclease superfamily